MVCSTDVDYLFVRAIEVSIAVIIKIDPDLAILDVIAVYFTLDEELHFFVWRDSQCLTCMLITYQRIVERIRAGSHSIVQVT